MPLPSSVVRLDDERPVEKNEDSIVGVVAPESSVVDVVDCWKVGVGAREEGKERT